MALRRELGPFDATMVVVGGIIGSGIFMLPAIVAQRLPTSPLVLAAWVAGGAIALAGAFAFAELAALFPQAGGEYVYLREAYHPLVAFLFGWASLLMIQGGGLGAVAITFAEYSLRLTGRDASAASLVAAVAIVVVAAVNVAGVKPGSRLLNVLVLLKLAALAALILGGLLLPHRGPAPALPPPPSTPAGSTALAFGAALVPILFAYGGWQGVNILAEETSDPRRTIPRALMYGTAIVITVYLLANVVYLSALGRAGLAATPTPASDAVLRIFGPGADRLISAAIVITVYLLANVVYLSALGRAGLAATPTPASDAVLRIFGPGADRLISAAIAVSAFGFLDLTLLAQTRIYYAMGVDRAFLPALARLHPRFGTPVLAIILQAAWGIVLVLTGTYGELVDSVVFSDWIFFALTAAAVFRFRSTVPLASRDARSFRMPGYPVVPALFVVAAAAAVVSAVRTNPTRSAVGVGLLALGVPVYALYAARRRQERVA